MTSGQLLEQRAREGASLPERLLGALEVAANTPGFGSDMRVWSELASVVQEAAAALTPLPGDDLDPFQIFDMGYCWRDMLTGQTLEDSRAVGRTLSCDLFEPIADRIDAAIKERGFDSFASSDSGIVECKAIIRQALSTPARSGDDLELVTELRDALVAVLNTGLNGGNNLRLAYIAAGRQALSDELLARAEASEQAVKRARAAIAAITSYRVIGGEQEGDLGADPALVASQSSPQAVSTKGFDPGEGAGK